MCRLARHRTEPKPPGRPLIRDMVIETLGCALDADASAAYGLRRPVCSRHGVVL